MAVEPQVHRVDNAPLYRKKDYIHINKFKGETFLFEIMNVGIYNDFGGDIKYYIYDTNDRATALNNIKATFDKVVPNMQYIDKIGVAHNLIKKHQTLYSHLFNALFHHNNVIYIYKDIEYFVGNGVLIANIKGEYVPLIVSSIDNEHLDYHIRCRKLNVKPLSKAINIRISPELLNSKSSEFKGLRTSFKKNLLPSLLEYNSYREDLNGFVKREIVPKFKTLKDQSSYLEDINQLYKSTIELESSRDLRQLGFLY